MKRFGWKSIIFITIWYIFLSLLLFVLSNFNMKDLYISAITLPIVYLFLGVMGFKIIYISSEVIIIKSIINPFHKTKTIKIDTISYIVFSGSGRGSLATMKIFLFNNDSVTSTFVTMNKELSMLIKAMTKQGINVQ